MASENPAMQSVYVVHGNAISFDYYGIEIVKASDRVQSERPIETPGFLISLILIARLAF